MRRVAEEPVINQPYYNMDEDFIRDLSDLHFVDGPFQPFVDGIDNLFIDQPHSDLDFTDDDDDAFEEDFDYDDEDDEDEAQMAAVLPQAGPSGDAKVHLKKSMQILLDSKWVLPHLVFYSYFPGGQRWPNPIAGKESYESVYKVLDELEVLLKAWKKRTDHPFTAHLTYDCQNLDDSEAGAQVDRYEPEDYLEDFKEYDFESVESDSHSYHPSRKDGEEASSMLTKKVYCQSSNRFYEIFKNEKEFTSMVSFVKHTKKYVFNIIFRLFLDAIPAELMKKLPIELWEKIWKFSQDPYNNSHIFCAGLRAKTMSLAMLEQRRIDRLFGSAGNLHMIIFNIMFVSSSLIRMPPLLEMDSLDKRGIGHLTYSRAFFNEFRQDMCVKVARLLDLEKLSGFAQHKSSPDLLAQSMEGCSLLTKIKRGIWIGKFVTCNPSADEMKTCENVCSDRLVMASDDSSLLLFTQKSPLTSTTSQIAFHIWDCDQRRCIKTILMNLASDDGSSLSILMKTSAVCLTRDALAILHKTHLHRSSSSLASCDKDTWTLLRWSLQLHGDTHTLEQAQRSLVQLQHGLVHGVSLVSTSHRGYLIHFVANRQTHLILVNPDTGSITWSHVLDQVIYVAGLRSDVLLLGSNGQQVNSTQLWHIQLGRLIEDYPSASICERKGCIKCKSILTSGSSSSETSSSSRPCTYLSRFDAIKSSKSLIIFAKSLAYYQVMRYDEEVDEKPIVLFSGSCYDYDMAIKPFLAVLVDNLLLVTHSQVDIPDPQYDLGSMFAVHLQSQVKYPIILGSNPSPSEQPYQPTLNMAPEPIRLLNEFGDTFFMRFLQPDHRVLLQISQDTYYELNFNTTVSQVAQLEADYLIKRHQKELSDLASETRL